MLSDPGEELHMYARTHIHMRTHELPELINLHARVRKKLVFSFICPNCKLGEDK